MCSIKILSSKSFENRCAGTLPPLLRLVNLGSLIVGSSHNDIKTVPMRSSTLGKVFVVVVKNRYRAYTVWIIMFSLI